MVWHCLRELDPVNADAIPAPLGDSGYSRFRWCASTSTPAAATSTTTAASTAAASSASA